MADADNLESIVVAASPKRALCLYCRSIHRVDLSCPCFRCGFRHDGDCATVCKFCDRVHSLSTGCSKRSRTYFTAAHRSNALFEHSIRVNDSRDRTAFVRHFLGDMDVICSHCRAKSWHGERINCCLAGSIVVPLQGDVPRALSELILSPHVRQNMRSYNSILAFASTGHSNKSFPDGTFVLGGRSYHRIGSLLPEAGHRHCFSQIWSLDTEDATARRLEVMPALRSSVLNAFHDMFMVHNPLATTFRQAASSVIGLVDGQIDSVTLSWHGADDSLKFEVASVIEHDGLQRNIVVRVNDGQLRSISDGHPLYHALAYPLLFPTGASGWHYNLSFNDRKISLTEYMRFMLMHRDHSSHIQRCERLALEFYCDAFAQVEARNLAFHRLATQQAKYVKAPARSIMDQLNSDNAHIIGTPVVLPSSFPNSPRFYHNLYLDALALPRKFGTPDLFITMTANPQWKEITDAIPPGSHWRHHQDIVGRVFYLKLKAMMDLIVKNKLFGEVLGFCYRIEWQARGMPHAHILIILKVKIESPRHIDEVVWAEIPCPVRYPILHAIVVQRMIHTPCDMKSESPCRQETKDGQCRRHFPKEFNTVTTLVGDGYPQYRRRGLFSVVRNGEIIDDRWVVPYNPYLLEVFDCHINVEVCASKKCFKYVYKYCFKAPDYCSIAVNEIDAYLSGRLLTASEATWRLLGLKLHKEYPSVVRLDVHLPEQQVVVFDPTQDVRDIFDAAERSSSSLLEWFALNRRDPSARRYLYTDIPEHYIWSKDTWMPRSASRKSISVGRIFAVSLRNVELFSLRTLLKYQRGCLSFADILTVDGVTHRTFQDACAALGLVEDDSEFVAAFTEYLETTVASIASIRNQFVLMLCAINALNAQRLFEHFSIDLIGTDTRNHALCCMEVKMRSLGKSLRDFDIDFTEECNMMHDDLHSNVDVDVHNQPSLSDEQSHALRVIVDMLSSAVANKIMAIIASAGTGKTMFVRTAVRALRGMGVSSMCVAASALAATLLPQGQTAHAALKIPLLCDDQSFCSWTVAQKEKLKTISVIFWDEISMVNYHIAETVDRTLRLLMRNDLLFGGKVVVFCGDFRQLPPVVKHGRGEFWSLLNKDWFVAARKVNFTKNFRVSTDASYDLMLQTVGDGIVNQVSVPESCIAHNLDEAIQKVFGDNVTDIDNDGKVMLAYTLHQCAIVNDAVFERIPGDITYSCAADDLSECTQPDYYPSEYVASLQIQGCPPAVLPLKLNARYMIMRNLNPPDVCNGITAKLIRFTKFNCSLQLLSGCGAGSIICLPRCIFDVASDASGLPFNFKRRQFPMTPAYCLSVHKSQGQTLKVVGFVGDSDAFTHGQLYVAMSRVGSWRQFIFYSPRSEDFIKNKVSKRLINALKLMSSNCAD
jgi:hypothetical protein